MPDETQFVKLTFEQLGRLTRKDPTELRENLTNENPDTGEKLSQEEQFDIISGYMTEHFKTVVHDSRKRGGKEILKSKLKQLSEKYDLDSVNDLDDIISVVETRAIESAKNDLTASNAFKMPEVQEKFKALQSTIEAQKKEIESIKTGYQKERTLSKVNSKALAILEAKGAKFSSDPEIKQRQIKAFQSILNANNYEVLDDGTINILNEDGLPMEDADYNKVSFSDFVVRNSVVDFGDVVNPKDLKGPKGNNSENGNDGFTKEQLENYSSIYMNLMGQGKREQAQRILEAGKKFKEQQKD